MEVGGVVAQITSDIHYSIQTYSHGKPELALLSTDLSGGCTMTPDYSVC